MDKMRSGTQVRSQIGVGLDSRQRRRRAAIAVLADQRIDASILAEFAYRGRENDQLTAIGKSHAGRH